MREEDCDFQASLDYVVTIYLVGEGAILDHKLGLNLCNEIIILVCVMCVQVCAVCLQDNKHLYRGQSTLPDVVPWALGWLAG